MKILVTGASGYVGNHLIQDLMKEHELTALVRSERTTGSISKIQQVIGDITEPASLRRLSNYSFDAVIHLAVSLLPVSDPRVNIDGLSNLLNEMENQNLERFIYISSALVYGPSSSKESTDEEVVCKPHMKMSKQQLQGENKCREFSISTGTPIVIFRPGEMIGGVGGFFFNDYMQGIKNRTIPQIGSGRNRISMTYVGDLVSCIKSSLTCKEAEGEIFNVTIPDTITANELNRFLSNKYKVNKPIRIPVPIAMLGAVLVSVVFKILQSKPPFNLEIAKIGTMDGPQRSIAKAQGILGFIPRYEDIGRAIHSCYF